MAIHDRYARRTAFELLFPDPARATAIAESVQAEAKGLGVDARHPHHFLTLGSVGAFLREIRAEDAPPESGYAFGVLAYHGIHFERAGRRLYLASEEAARAVVRRAPGGRPEPPAEAGYLQLPQHLFWLEPEGQVPEPIDGIFWTLDGTGLLHSLLATGLRPDRPGLGAIPVPEAPLAEADAWKEADARGDGTDFRSGIPGSELEGLHGIRTAGEALELLARFFALLAEEPGVPREPAADGSAEGPPPSALPYVRIDVATQEER